MSEKRWYIFLGGRRAGPFSDDEVNAKINSGEITRDSKTWAEGLGSWAKISEVDLANPPPKPEVTGSMRRPPAEGTISRKIVVPKALGGRKPQAQPSRSRTFLLSLLFVVALAGGGYYAWEVRGMRPRFELPAVQGLLARIPFLGAWLAPLAPLEGVSEEEMANLNAAARAGLSDGAKAALVVLSPESSAPPAYVATNLPERARIEILVHGKAGALAGAGKHSALVKAEVEERLATVASLSGEDGAPLPKGEYLVTVMEAENQPDSVREALGNVPAAAPPPEGVDHLPPGRKLYASRELFLGGVKDAAYEAELKDFQERLNLQLLGTARDSKRFLDEIRKQLATSTQMADTVSPTKSKVWIDFHARWTTALRAMGDRIRTALNEALQRDPAQSEFFQSLDLIRQDVLKLHEFHHALAMAELDKPGFEAQVRPLAEKIEKGISALQSKILAIDKTLQASGGAAPTARVITPPETSERPESKVSR